MEGVRCSVESTLERPGGARGEPLEEARGRARWCACSGMTVLSGGSGEATASKRRGLHRGLDAFGRDGATLGHGRTYDQIDERLAQWLSPSPVFSCHRTARRLRPRELLAKATARVRCARGRHRVAYLDQTGSGCGNNRPPEEERPDRGHVLRLRGPPRMCGCTGRGQVTLLDEPGFDALAEHFEDGHGPGVRAVITVDVERVATRADTPCPYGLRSASRRARRLVGAQRPRGHPDYWAQIERDEHGRRRGITA